MAVGTHDGVRPRGAARREALLDAVLRIVAEEGVDAVTHRRVADVAGLPLASTTYWFDSKEHLLTAALERAADRDIERLREFLGVAPEPKTWYFDSAQTNPTPDPAVQSSGAASGILHMQTGDTISWECDVTNNNVQGGIMFANAVYTGEMCNMFGMYVPSMGGPWSASNF